MFYQYTHASHPDYFCLEDGKDFSYPTHLHYCFEIILVTEGEMIITISKDNYSVKQGECAIIFPNQLHSLHTPSASKHKLCIFSKELISTYSMAKNNLLPKKPIFKLDNFCCELFEKQTYDTQLLQIKGVLYFILGHIEKQAVYKKNNNRNEEILLEKVLQYVESNYKTNDCSLMELSKLFNYDYAYLSKYFVKHVKIKFNHYINMRKIFESCNLLISTQKRIIDISNDVGYASLRSFNRNFKKIMGISPEEYRTQKNK